MESVCREDPLIIKRCRDCDLHGRQGDAMIAYLLVITVIVKALDWV